MNNQLQIFNNTEFGQVRTIVNGNKILFCASDIAKALGYARPADAITTHCKGVVILPTPSKGGVQQTKFIPEGDIYRLIIKSKLPSAEKFESWVFDEVLPSIRKTGSYSLKEVSKEELGIRRDEVQIAKSKLWLELADRVDIKEYKELANSYAFNTLAGKSVLPLPEVKELTYSATEVGEIFGVSKNKIGALANKHNLKTGEYGKWFYDKSRYSNKEVQTFRYNKKAIEVFKELIA